MNLYLIHNYNTYFNRIVKIISFDDISSYTYDYLPNANWNPNDGVTATQVVNFTFDSGVPDYLVCFDGTNIVSRWFILEAKRERTGQYTLSLRRDVVADYYDQIVDAPCFIQKATLKPTDPMIFNPEGMTYNQIKKSETLLKDQSACAWIVGYIAESTDTEVSYEVSVSVPSDYDYTNTSVPYIGDIISYGGSVDYTGQPNQVRFQFNIGTSSTNIPLQVAVFTDGTLANVTGTNRWYGGFNGSRYGTITDTSDNIALMRSNLAAQVKEFKTDLRNGLKSKVGFNSDDLNEVLSLNGKIIYNLDDGVRYKIVIYAADSEDVDLKLSVTGTDSINVTMKTIFDNALTVVGGTKDIYYGTEQMEVVYTTQAYKIAVLPISTGTITTSVATSRTLKDAPYKMFAIPYSPDKTVVVQDINFENLATMSSTTALAVASAIAKKFGKTYLYDMQLLPYAPIPDEYCWGGWNWDYVRFLLGTDDKEGDLYQWIKDSNDNKVGIIFFPEESSGTKNIYKRIDTIDTKVESECDMYRLVSPNYQGTFEFNAAKNGGVQYFNVDYTYKPFNVYIHINPNFGLLYGIDFNDSRGLICGGDFSMPIANSQWETYEISNKNYQNIFDRQITNMEINQKYQMINQLGNAGVGTMQGAAIGGSMGPVGAAVGMVASGVGGAIDTSILQAQQTEAKSYSIDMFNYQMGNIKALPMSLTKTSALTFNNKIFPFLEYYTCTDEEKEALRLKLKYNGMTVMRIGTIREFIQGETSFIQGQLIRLTDLADDDHIAREIYNEIAKGVYL